MSTAPLAALHVYATPHYAINPDQDVITDVPQPAADERFLKHLAPGRYIVAPTEDGRVVLQEIGKVLRGQMVPRPKKPAEGVVVRCNGVEITRHVDKRVEALTIGFTGQTGRVKLTVSEAKTLLKTLDDVLYGRD